MSQKEEDTRPDDREYDERSERRNDDDRRRDDREYDAPRERERIVLTGELPSPLNPPTGCTFHPRCPWMFEPCPRSNPHLLAHDGSLVACHAVNPPDASTKAA